jgi:hypothetical protein
MDPEGKSFSSSSESDPTWKWRRPAAVAARAERRARGSQRQSVHRPVRQHPYARPSFNRGAKLRTPSDDEDEVLGPVKVQEGAKEEKMKASAMVHGESSVEKEEQKEVTKK